MTFEEFISKVLTLQEGESVEWWNFRVEVGTAGSYWILWKNTYTSLALNRNEAVAIIRGMYKLTEMEGLNEGKTI